MVEARAAISGYPAPMDQRHRPEPISPHLDPRGDVLIHAFDPVSTQIQVWRAPGGTWVTLPFGLAFTHTTDSGITSRRVISWEYVTQLVQELPTIVSSPPPAPAPARPVIGDVLHQERPAPSTPGPAGHTIIA